MDISEENKSTFSAKAFYDAKEQKLLVKLIKSIKFDNKSNQHLCLVVDISGSMETTDNNNISRIQIVVFVLKIIISMLPNNYHLTIITFNNNTNILFENLQLTEDGKENAKKHIMNLEGENGTMMLNAISCAHKIMNKYKHFNIILLTDGVPSEDNTIEGYKNIEKQGNLHTIGFGSSIDSSIIVELANIGKGIFRYVSDTSMVASNIINFVCYILTSHKNYEITIETKEKNYNFTTPKLQIDDEYEYNLIYDIQDEPINLFVDNIKIPIHYQDISDFSKFYYRLVNILKNFTENFFLIYIFEENITKLYDDFATSQDYDIQRMLQDISYKDKQGELYLASDNLRTWGKHYCYSYYYSLINMIPLSNLNTGDGSEKDVGLETFALTKYIEYRNWGYGIFKDLFKELPQPQPIVSRYYSSNNYSSNPYSSPSSSSYDYYNGSRGCIGENTYIKMPWGARKVSDLKKGDEVYSISLDGRRIISTISCILKINITNPIEVCDLKLDNDKLIITPNHPVANMGCIENDIIRPCNELNWKHPKELVKQRLIKPDELSSVYNISLDSGTGVFVGDYFVCTMAHNILDNQIVSHEFFGTNQVLKSLKRDFPNDFEKGFIETNYDELKCERDENGWVIDIKVK